MAAEGIETLPTSDRVAPKDRNMRRNSSEKKSTSGSGEKGIPHYLRASTSSCHEFCKYGRKHDFEEEKRPTLKELRAKMIQDQKAGKTVNQVEIKFTPIKSKTLPDPPVQVYETPKIIKKETASSNSFFKRENVSKEKDSPSQLVRVSETPKMMKKGTTSFKRTNVSKPKSSPDQLIQVLERTKTLKETTSFKRTNSSEPKVSPDQLVRLLEKPKIIKETTSFKGTNVSPKPSPAKLSLSPLSTSGGVTDRRTSESKVPKMAGVSKIGWKKAAVLPKASLSPRLSVNRVASLITKSKVLKTASSLLRNQKVTKDGSNLSNNEEVREKTLYIINPNPEEGSSESGYNLTCLPERDVEKERQAGEECKESVYTTDEALSETDEDVNRNPLDKEKYKRNPRRSVHLDDEELARKLNFRRGKVVNPQAENNGARRLKFNRGKVLESNQNGANDNRRRYKKREVNNDDANNGKPESENVVLRRQDAQGKKDTQGLYNNVIEETASKLVEKRKSKVKALVGAFETVISLQESKPSTQQH